MVACSFFFVLNPILAVRAELSYFGRTSRRLRS
jgi:hypothetical protein